MPAKPFFVLGFLDGSWEDGAGFWGNQTFSVHLVPFAETPEPI